MTSEQKKQLRQQNEKWAAGGLRVLAVKYRPLEQMQDCSPELENSGIFLGMAAMLDPPRPESKMAVLTAKKAGTVKITATIGKKTYTYPYTVIARSQKNVLDIIWNQYVTSGMSDYEKAVAAQQWMQQNVSPNGTSVLAQKALEQGKANYKGFCEAYQLIMKHYGISAKVVNGKKHMENSVVIAGKKYTASTLETSANADKTYTTTTIPGLAVNRVTMVLSKGRTGTFKVIGQSKGITWSSSNTKVAVVNASGKVTAKGTGTAKVTLKVNGKTFACTVCVNP